MRKPTVTAALKIAHQEVTELRSCGFENSCRAWSFNSLSHRYNAWVESDHTWYVAAVQQRRMAMVRAAINWACREFDLAIPYEVENAIEQGVWANHSVRDVLKAELPRLIVAA